MAIQSRALARQLGQYRLPRVPRMQKVEDCQKWAEELLRAMEQQITVLTGVEDNGTTFPIRSTIDFIGCSVTDDLTHDRTQVSVGGGAGAAPVNATYLVVSLNGTLTAERVLVAGNGLTSADGGAGGNFTITAGAGAGLSSNTDELFITDTGVGAASYGSATQVGSFTVNSRGQLTAAANVPIAIGGFAFGSNLTAPGAYPYLVLSSDLLVMVDTSSARTINLPAAVAKHAVFIKDVTGGAFANNVTITPDGSEKIDTTGTLVLANNFDSVFLAGTGISGNEWAVL